jgi:hypothetical protein
MPDPANLTRHAVTVPEPQLIEGKILDSAEDPTEEVRCTFAGDDVHASDPMPWDPVVRKAGFFYPKRGDRAVIAFPDGGTPYIDFFRPSATSPDDTF